MPGSRDTEDLPGISTETSEVPELWERLRQAPVPALTISYHPNLERVGERAFLATPASGRSTTLSRLEPRFAQPAQLPVRALADVHVSRKPVELTVLEDGSVEIRREGERPDLLVDGVPVDASLVVPSQRLEQGAVLLYCRRVVLLLHLADRAPSHHLHGLVGHSPGLARVRTEVDRVADQDLPVLLRGESGTGKELVARAIHAASNRSQGPFVAVNMATVLPHMAASQLFGHTRGAFTGADRARLGSFAEADGGTLFLDEVGDTPAEVQAMLLRVLETAEITPLGGDRARKVDVRVLAATDAELDALAEQGEFRTQLLHRLCGYEILLPSLRDRREDIGRLFVGFLLAEAERTGDLERVLGEDELARPWLPPAVTARLLASDWPGNVRQLKNVARQIAVASRGHDHAVIGPAVERLLTQAQPLCEAAEAARERPPEPTPAGVRSLADISEDELLEALRASDWQPTHAAERLGVSRMSVYKLIKRSSRVRSPRELSADTITKALEANKGDVARAARSLEISARGL